MQVTLTLSKTGAAVAQLVNLPRFLLEHSLTRRLLLLQVASCMLMQLGQALLLSLERAGLQAQWL